MFMTIDDTPKGGMKDQTVRCVCGHMLYFHGDDERECREDDCTCEVFELPARVFCLDCETDAMESCIRWHTTREKRVTTMSETKTAKEAANEHSPLPWYIRRTAVYDTIRIVDDGLVAFVGIEPPPCANARYIVKAANAYPALVQTLRDELEALTVWQHAIHPRSDVQEGIAISIDKVRKVLALAEKGGE